MEYRVQLTPTPEGWEVMILDATSRSVLTDPANGQPLRRCLRRVGDGVTAFPQPKDEPPVIPDQDLREAYLRIVGRDPGADGVARFGRYLFSTVLGGGLWQAIDRAAGTEPIELSFAWDEADRALSRLPWEMLHDGTEFLAQKTLVSLLRRVVGTPQVAGTIVSPPRVLFVVGTQLNRDAIVPGAEYLGLLRSLRSRGLGLSLKTHIVLQASTERLAEAVEWFRPTVLHFICHGGCGVDGNPYLLLTDHDDPARDDPVSAERLLRTLKSKPPLPQIVVLNACYSATVENADLYAEAGQVASPFAVELVRAGVSVVVGMAGAVADRACRLFTRRFYEAILQDGDIARATSVGRRVGIINHEQHPPASSVDWAMPTLFFSDGVEQPRLEVKPEPLEEAWHRLADDLDKYEYPVFCGRLDLVHLFDQLMEEEAVQQRTSAEGRAYQVLDFWVGSADSDDTVEPGPRYGRTWLLRQLAVKAARGGHVPVFVGQKAPPGAPKEGPKDATELIQAILQASVPPVQRLGLTWAPRYTRELGKLAPGADLPHDFPTEIHQACVLGDPRSEPARAAALMMDLLALLEQARAKRPPDDADRAKLLLVFDDVHAFGHLAAGFLFRQLLISLRLATALDKVRVLLAHASVGSDSGQNPTINTIQDETKAFWIKQQELKEFATPADRIAYTQFLLNWRDNNRKDGPRTALAVAPNCLPAHQALIFEDFTDEVAGIPSRLESPKLAALITKIRTRYSKAVGFDLLRDANDDAILQALVETRGGQP